MSICVKQDLSKAIANHESDLSTVINLGQALDQVRLKTKFGIMSTVGFSLIFFRISSNLTKIIVQILTKGNNLAIINNQIIMSMYWLFMELLILYNGIGV